MSAFRFYVLRRPWRSMISRVAHEVDQMADNGELDALDAVYYRNAQHGTASIDHILRQVQAFKDNIMIEQVPLVRTRSSCTMPTPAKYDFGDWEYGSTFLGALLGRPATESPPRADVEEFELIATAV